MKEAPTLLQVAGSRKEFTKLVFWIKESEKEKKYPNQKSQYFFFGWDE